MMEIKFKKAVKYNARGRVALVGPGGSGKSLTMLRIAYVLAGPGGRIAAVDTEHESLSKYAPSAHETADNVNLFDFDVFDMKTYSPDNWIAALTAAEKAKYDVFCTDSLSHFWVGKDGALEFVDNANKRHTDKMGGWKDFRPHEREMVDRMIASPCHIITTMRTKTEYVEVEKNGRKTRQKIGLQPVQRDGLEYEFDLVGYMTDENDFVTDKTRCQYYRQRVISMPGSADFVPLIDWLKGDKREEEIAPTERKPPASQQGAPPPQDLPTASGKPPAEGKPWSNFRGMVDAFVQLRSEMPEADFGHFLRKHGVESADRFKTTDEAVACYAAMRAFIAERRQAA